MSSTAEILEWRDYAVAALKASGPLTPQQLGDKTATGPQSAVQRARKFPNYFTLIERPGESRGAKSPVDRIDLVPALRRA